MLLIIIIFMKLSSWLLGLFLIILIILLAEVYLFFNLKSGVLKNPSVSSPSPSLSPSSSSCMIFPERFCQTVREKKTPDQSRLLTQFLPAGTAIYSPWEGIIYLNQAYFSPYKAGALKERRIASAHLSPPLKFMEQNISKKRILTVVYGDNVEWLVKNGETTKKGQVLGRVVGTNPLFPQDKSNLGLIFSDYRGNDAGVKPDNFSQFFDYNQ
ncbi:MAG: hypothetical protein QXP27_07190 [Candidatus Methanomethyliaceae archaeon]